MDHVGSRRTEIACPSQVVEQGAFHGQVAYGVTSFVEVQESVKSYGDGGADVSSYASIRLQTAAGTETHDFQLAEGIILFAGLEIDVGQCVEFIHYNVYIVTSDTGGGYRDAFSLVSSGDGTEFTAFYFTFFSVEMGGHEFHASGIAHQNDFIRQILRFYVKMEH